MTEPMNQKPLVSCIIIFFNAGEQFFIEAIASIFAQTYDHWELLLADDGSTDESTAIAQRYAQQYPEKVCYLEHENHENRGMSAARNLGIRHARGKYISFLDADDVWLPQKLERQVEILNSHPGAAMVCGPTQFWYGWTGKPEDIQRDVIWPMGSIPLNRLFNPPILLTFLLQGETQVRSPSTCSVLILRKIFEEIEGSEEAFRGIYEDYVLFSKIYLKAPVFVIDECLDRYRQHPDSDFHITQENSNLTGPNPYELKYLTWLSEYLTNHRVIDSDLEKAFQKSLRPYQYPFLYKLKTRIDKIYVFLKQRLRPFKSIFKRFLVLYYPNYF